MAKSKPTKSNIKKTERPAKVKKLHEELGKLTYEIASLKEQINKKAKRSNEIGQALEKFNG
jgi:peptidoglycan hydrolase CwlO-like protein